MKINRTYLIPVLFFANYSFAAEDVCCVLSSNPAADSVQTVAQIMSSNDCKVGSLVQGQKVCAAVADPNNSYCSQGTDYKDRCTKCGYFWSGKECLTIDPKLKATKEIEKEMKASHEKSAITPAQAAARIKTVVPPPLPPEDPDNPRINNKPEDDGLFTRRNRGVLTDDH